MKVETLAWLSQNISFRMDLNARENFLATAERRDSLIRLAQNISYKVSRVRSARGQLRIERIRTNEPLFDSNNISLQDREIIWADARNEDWFEQFITVMNSAFISRTQFGRPLTRVQDGNLKKEQYVFNGLAPTSGSYAFSTDVSGVSLPFNIVNARLNKDNGNLEEYSPISTNAFNAIYVTDGFGFNSSGTGFFVPFKQGNLQFQDFNFDEPESIRIVELSVANINNDDFFIQELTTAGNVIRTWEKVDTVFGESVSFLPTNDDEFGIEQSSGDARNVYEIDTLDGDLVRVRFGDGSFGRIPQGRFRFWFRTANPQPLSVNPSDVGLQTFVIPYSSNEQFFNLTITVSLKDTVVNAAASETNLSIRRRANQVYYAQNRMITGRDYNQFFLRDNSIQKVKTVNRTFSGHSRYTKLHDPTGLYENVKIQADDGRFYIERVLNVNFVTGDTDVIPNERLIQDEISPLILQSDKEQLYYNDYPEPLFDTSHFWFEDSVVNGLSRGRIVSIQGIEASAIKVGDATVNSPAKFVKTDSIIRLTNARGRNVRVNRVIDDGDITDGIILDQIVTNGERVFSATPNFRTKFNDSEKIAMLGQLDLKVDFGLSWHQDTQTWEVITFDNLDKQTDGGLLDLNNQGDTSKTNKDASWMIYLEFIPGGDDVDTWKIVDRGLGLFFESAREHDFFFANNEPVIDPETGKVNRDLVNILACNEARDSLRRRGLAHLNFTNMLECDIFCYEFIGDGTTTEFQTSENPLAPEAVVSIDGVLQFLDIDYSIQTKVSGDTIHFVAPPSDGASITICLSQQDSLSSVTTKVKTFVSDGSTEQFFDLEEDFINGSNTLVFVDGVFQTYVKDYVITTSHPSFPPSITGNAALQFTGAAVLGAGARITIFYFKDLLDEILKHNSYVGDGITDEFVLGIGDDQYPLLGVPPLLPNRTLDPALAMVFLDGVHLNDSEYTITNDSGNTTTSTITFNTAPAVGQTVSIVNVSDISATTLFGYNFTPPTGASNYELFERTIVADEGVLTFRNGILQEGPWGDGSTLVENGNEVKFVLDVPDISETLFIRNLLGAVGRTESQSIIDQPPGDPVDCTDAALGTNNFGNVSTNSSLVQYLGRDIPLHVHDVLRHADGYINENGISVESADLDNSGFVDNIFVFKDVVLQDGITDLVLWRKVEEFGFTVLEPISLTTRPRGTYGLSSQGDVAEGVAIDNSVFEGIPHQVCEALPLSDRLVLDGDIHYDITTETWLIADLEDTQTWIEAPDQTLFHFAIGRGNLKFQWLHFSPDEFRIDPSVSNIMDAYILTSNYDEQFRIALFNNVPLEDFPVAPTPEELRIQFADFDNFKAMSDSIVYHPARYKILFGKEAIPELQATFKLIQSEGSLLSENDLKIRIFNTIDTYFSSNNFDFGETFYMTELLAFIHQELAPNIQSIVAVPKHGSEVFGRLFQVRSEPDELFVSSANVEDIEVVTSFTDNELRIGIIA